MLNIMLFILYIKSFIYSILFNQIINLIKLCFLFVNINITVCKSTISNKII